MAVRWKLEDSDCPTNAEGIKWTPVLVTSSLLSLPTHILPGRQGKSVLLSKYQIRFEKIRFKNASMDCLLLHFNSLNVCYSSFGF